MSTPNYITPAGAERLRQELYHLIHEARPAAVDAVAEAAAHGDRSENAEYIYGKKKLREIDRRINFLSGRLDKAEVVGPPEQAPDRIHFGATVVVEDDDGREHTYRLVGADEIDPKQGFISWRSPVARALLGKKAGDDVEVTTPSGSRDLHILRLSY